MVCADVKNPSSINCVLKIGCVRGGDDLVDFTILFEEPFVQRMLL